MKNGGIWWELSKRKENLCGKEMPQCLKIWDYLSAESGLDVSCVALQGQETRPVMGALDNNFGKNK